MQGDTAWLEDMSQRMFPNTTLQGRANLFVMPNLDAANIPYNMIKVMTEGVAIGTILMGIDHTAHILIGTAPPHPVDTFPAIVPTAPETTTPHRTGRQLETSQI